MAALEREGEMGVPIGGPTGPDCVLALAVGRKFLQVRGGPPGSGNVQWCVGRRFLLAVLSLLSCLGCSAVPIKMLGSSLTELHTPRQ